MRAPDPWPEERLRLVQAVWGRGFAGPNDADRAVDLVKGCGLTKADTLLDIGPGLGGGPLAVTNRFRSYVVAQMGHKNLAEAAKRLAESYGLTERLQFGAVPFEALTVKSKFYRAVLVRDVLHRVPDKERLLRQAVAGLRDPDSQLVVCGITCDGDSSSPVFAEWMAGERASVHPFSLVELKARLAALSLTLRTEKDETAWYRGRVQQAWRDFQDTIAGEDLPAESRAALLAESELWARRLAAFEAGILKYHRLVAVRKGD